MPSSCASLSACPVMCEMAMTSSNIREKQGVESVSLTEGFDTTAPMGRIMLGIAAVFAQLTRETIAENVRTTFGSL